MSVEKITPEKLATLKAKSVLNIPDDPSARGMTAKQLKASFTNSLVGSGTSLVTEVNRVVDEVNNELNLLETKTSDELNLLRTYTDTELDGLKESINALDELNPNLIKELVNFENSTTSTLSIMNSKINNLSNFRDSILEDLYTIEKTVTSSYWVNLETGIDYNNRRIKVNPKKLLDNMLTNQEYAELVNEHYPSMVYKALGFADSEGWQIPVMIGIQNDLLLMYIGDTNVKLDEDGTQSETQPEAFNMYIIILQVTDYVEDEVSGEIIDYTFESVCARVTTNVTDLEPTEVLEEISIGPTGDYTISWLGNSVDLSCYLANDNSIYWEDNCINKQNTIDDFWNFIQVEVPATTESTLELNVYLKDEVDNKLRTVEEEPTDWNVGDYIFKEIK